MDQRGPPGHGGHPLDQDMGFNHDGPRPRGPLGHPMDPDIGFNHDGPRSRGPLGHPMDQDMGFNHEGQRPQGLSNSNFRDGGDRNSGFNDHYGNEEKLPEDFGGHNKSPPSGPGGRPGRDPRSRDPRRGTGKEDKESLEKEKEKRMLEVDLSMFGDLELPDMREKDEPEATDEEPNDLGLPFKPHIPSAVAKEIDASIHSHSPLEYNLRKIALSKPDYSEILSKHHFPMSKVQLKI